MHKVVDKIYFYLEIMFESSIAIAAISGDKAMIKSNQFLLQELDVHSSSFLDNHLLGLEQTLSCGTVARVIFLSESSALNLIVTNLTGFSPALYSDCRAFSSSGSN